MNKMSLFTILLSLGSVLHILDATFDTWPILASGLSCSFTSDWKIWIEKGGFAFQHSRTAVEFARTKERSREKDQGKL